jgi:hypothetical protein
MKQHNLSSCQNPLQFSKTQMTDVPTLIPQAMCTKQNFALFQRPRTWEKKKMNTRGREHTESNSTTVEEVDPHGFAKVLINKEALSQFSECIFAAAAAVELS